MEISELAPDDFETVTAVTAVINATDAVDCPGVMPETPKGLAGYLRNGWDGELPRSFVGRDESGTVVAALGINASDYDNTHQAWATVRVVPEARRRGYGRALLDFAEQHTRDQGRRILGAGGWDTEALTGFAAATGYVQKIVEVNRRQDLRTLDRPLVDELHAEATKAAGDYELLRFVGPVPAELLPAVVEMTAAINDAPTDDLDFEDEVFTVERVQAFEQAMLARDRRLYRLIARHRDTGELAGHTDVAVEAERPAVSWQLDTSVVRAHRGHRLGLLLKSDMLRWLTEVEPQVETVDTWNAESNDHMIGVNERLGYRIVGRSRTFQRELTP